MILCHHLGFKREDFFLSKQTFSVRGVGLENEWRCLLLGESLNFQCLD